MEDDIEDAINTVYEIPKLTVSKVKDILRFILTHANILAYVENAMEKEKNDFCHEITSNKDREYSEEEGEIIECTPQKLQTIKPKTCTVHKSKFERSSHSPKLHDLRTKITLERNSRESRERNSRESRERNSREGREQNNRESRERNSRESRERNSRESKERNSRESREQNSRESREQNSRESREGNSREKENSLISRSKYSRSSKFSKNSSHKRCSRYSLTPNKFRNNSKKKYSITKNYSHSPAKKKHLSDFCSGELLSKKALKFESENKKTYEVKNKKSISSSERTPVENQFQNHKRLHAENDCKVEKELPTSKRLKVNEDEEIQEIRSESIPVQDNEVLIISVNETLEREHNEKPKALLPKEKVKKSTNNQLIISDTEINVNQLPSSKINENKQIESDLCLTVTIPSSKFEITNFPTVSPLSFSPSNSISSIKSTVKGKKKLSDIIAYQVISSPTSSQLDNSLPTIKNQNETLERNENIKESINMNVIKEKNLPLSGPLKRKLDVSDSSSEGTNSKDLNKLSFIDLVDDNNVVPLQEDFLKAEKALLTDDLRWPKNCDKIENNSIDDQKTSNTLSIKSSQKLKTKSPRLKKQTPKKKSLSPRRPLSNISKFEKLPLLKVKLPIIRKKQSEIKTVKPTFPKKCMNDKVFKSVYSQRLEQKIKALEIAEAQAKSSPTIPVIDKNVIRQQKEAVFEVQPKKKKHQENVKYPSVPVNNKTLINSQQKETIPVEVQLSKKDENEENAKSESNKPNEPIPLSEVQPQKIDSSENNLSIWNRTDDKVILATCRQHGQTDMAFQIAADVISSRTPEEVKKRFFVLMDLFKKKLEAKNYQA